MIFSHTIEKVLAGLKTETRRLVKSGEEAVCQAEMITSIIARSQGYPNGRLKYKVGQTYAVQPNRGKAAVGRIKLLEIRQQDVRDIVNDEVRREGFENRVEFLKVWVEIHDIVLVRPEWLISEGLLKNRPDDRYQAWVLRFELVKGVYDE